MAQPEIPGNGVGIPRMPFGSDGSNWIALLVDALGRLQVDAEVDNFPADPATQTTLASALTALQSIQTLVGALHDVGLDELDVQVITSALPTGASTETTLDAVKTAVEIIDGFADPQNLIFGYNDRVLDYDSTDTLGAGYNAKYSNTPPADEVWIITAAHVKNVNRACSMSIGLGNATDGYITAKSGTSSGAGDALAVSGTFILKNGDTIRYEFGDATAGDDGNWGCAGYKMKIS